tara:strand:- start:131 stop:373 length:243 start_codon:yes stop_codon:yes gene_type:complete
VDPVLVNVQICVGVSVLYDARGSMLFHQPELSLYDAHAVNEVFGAEINGAYLHNAILKIAARWGAQGPFRVSHKKLRRVA